MNALSTGGLYVTRQTNGDVWIRSGYWADKLIIIPKEYRAELAQLLCPVTPEHDNKVDYSRCAGEPE